MSLPASPYLTQGLWVTESGLLQPPPLEGHAEAAWSYCLASEPLMDVAQRLWQLTVSWTELGSGRAAGAWPGGGGPRAGPNRAGDLT